MTTPTDGNMSATEPMSADRLLELRQIFSAQYFRDYWRLLSELCDEIDRGHNAAALNPVQASEPVGETTAPTLQECAAALDLVRDSHDQIRAACEKLTGEPLPPTPREKFDKKCPALKHLRTIDAARMSPELTKACLIELYMAVAALSAVPVVSASVTPREQREEPTS